MRKIILGGLVLVAVVIGGAGAYIWFSGGSGEPSTEVTAATLATTTTTQAPTEATEAPADTTETTVDAGGQVIFAIDKTQSSVTFTLDEVLRGDPAVVVGTTNEIAGEVLIDFTDPAASQLGEIVVNVRTLETGNSFRNRAIRGPILNSADDAFEFATFAPTGLDGLPGSIAVGDTVAFSVTGDLEVAGESNPVTFDVSLTVVSGARVEGTGMATVTRADYGLTIPDAPGVANVSEEVGLGITFVALAS